MNKFGSEVFRSMASISVTFLLYIQMFYLLSDYSLFHEADGGVNNSIVVVFCPSDLLDQQINTLVGGMWTTFIAQYFRLHLGKQVRNKLLLRNFFVTSKAF
uniref:Uncharacterized protein n=1 Tax=Micrurus spixii TaxID=129469 RepID=A0A2D4MAN9_9SAUR